MPVPPAPGPLAAERHLGPLRPGVGDGAAVASGRQLQAGEIEPLGVHPARGDGDHPRRRGGEQRGPQQAGQQEWRNDLAGTSARCRGGAWRTGVDSPGVMDEDVQAPVADSELRGRRPGPLSRSSRSARP